MRRREKFMARRRVIALEYCSSSSAVSVPAFETIIKSRVMFVSRYSKSCVEGSQCGIEKVFSAQFSEILQSLSKMHCG